MPRRSPPPRLIGSGLIPAHFGLQAGDIESEYQDTLARLGRDEQSLFRDIGFSGNIDPTTGKTKFELDPTNRFGSYQQMIREFANNLTAQRAAMIGRGLRRSGGLGQARENLLRFQLDQGKSGMLNKFTQSAANIYGSRGAALTNKNRGLNRLEGEALSWWDQYGPEDPDVPPPAPAAPAAEAHAPAYLPPAPAPSPEYGPGGSPDTQPYHPWAPRPAATPQQQLMQTMGRVIRRVR